MSDDQVMFAAVVFGIAVFSTLMMWANSIKAKQQEAAMQACTFQTAEEAIKFVEWQKAEKVREVEKMMPACRLSS